MSFLENVSWNVLCKYYFEFFVNIIFFFNNIFHYKMSIWLKTILIEI